MVDSTKSAFFGKLSGTDSVETSAERHEVENRQTVFYDLVWVYGNGGKSRFYRIDYFGF